MWPKIRQHIAPKPGNRTVFVKKYKVAALPRQDEYSHNPDVCLIWEEGGRTDQQFPVNFMGKNLQILELFRVG